MFNTSTQPNSLDDFQGWDQEGNDEDFFKELDSTSTVENPEAGEEEEEEEPGEAAEEILEPKAKKEEKDMFAELEEEDEEEEEEEEDESGKPSNLKSVEALNFMKERGLVDYELEEGQELTDEYADQIIEDSFDQAVEGRVQDLFEDLPDVVRQLNNFVLKGGDPRSFISSLSNESQAGLSEDMDMSDEADQETVIRETMKAEGDDNEIIEAQIEFLKDSGKLKLFADRNFSKWKKATQSRRQELLDNQKEIQRQAKENLREAKRKMSELLTKEKDFGGISIGKEDAKVLPSYVNDRTVKLQNGSYISELQKELYYDLPQNEKAYLQLATLMKNRNKDGTFNFDSIMEKATTKVSREIKDNVRRSKTSIPTNSKNGTSNNSRKALADFF